jgi:hypothetical protein
VFSTDWRKILSANCIFIVYIGKALDNTLHKVYNKAYKSNMFDKYFVAVRLAED